MSKLSHLDEQGRAHIVDVSGKAVTARVATASGSVRMTADALKAIAGAGNRKGDVLATAQLAGIMAAKRTGELIPLCHPLPLDAIDVEVEIDAALPGVIIRARVATTGRTGVEMEALTAVSVACLTLYDMVKAVDRTMVIGDIRLDRKSGGRSGDWSRAR